MFKRIKKQLVEGRELLTYTSLRAASQVLSVALLFVIAKFFDEDMYGSYSLARMIVFFVAALTISSAQTPFVVHANHEREKSGKINKSFSVQFVFLGTSICLFFLIVTLFPGAIAVFAKISTSDLVYMFLAFVGFSFHNFLFNLFLALGERTKSALVVVVYNSLTILFVVFFYLVYKIDIATVFLVYFLAGVLLVILFVGAVDYKALLPLCFELNHFKEMFKFMRWVMLGVTAVYFINWGSNIILRIFVSMHDIGVYNFAFTVFKGLLFLTSALSHYFLPFLSLNIERKKKLFRFLAVKRPKIIALGIACLVIVLFVFPYLRELVYGSKYAESERILQVLLLANAITLYTVFYRVLFYALKRYKCFQIAVAVQLVIVVILSLVLVPKMGIMGAAISTVISYICRAVILEVYFRTRIKGLLI